MATELSEEKSSEREIEREEKVIQNITDNEKARIKSYIHMINLAVAARRPLNIYLHQKSCELYEKSVKSFS